MENLLGDPNNASESLNKEQLSVLDLVSERGSGTFWVRDRAKKMGVARPLNVIKELTDLGLIEKARDNNNVSILIRIR